MGEQSTDNRPTNDRNIHTVPKYEGLVKWHHAGLQNRAIKVRVLGPLPNMESNAAGLVLRLALKTRFS